MSQRYWKGVEELQNDPEFARLKNNEFYEHLPLDSMISKKAEDVSTTPRRDFLKFLGFSVAAASLAACETPVQKTIPYLIRPDQITPGIPNWYASTYFDGYDYCSVLVKTRDGRPIKIEGNTLSSVTRGGVSARVQASVLSLYDSGRLKSALASGKEAAWADVDKAITTKLAEIAAAGGKIRILSSTVISPTVSKAIADFAAKYPTTQHVQYDAFSASALRQAHNEGFGVNAVPSYDFSKADVIVGIDCDFLAHWVSPIEHARQYAETRKLDEGKKTMSRHIQYEAALSLTGSNADQRHGMKPSMAGAVAANLYNAVAAKAGATAVSAPSAGELSKAIEKTAEELWAAKGKSLVVCGTNDLATQHLVAGINSLLENYGTTVDLDNTNRMRQGNDTALATLLDELGKGEVAALFVYNANPVYTLPNGTAVGEMIRKAGLTVSFADRNDETAACCQYVCPDHHALESWSDAEPRSGAYSLGQPTISPLFQTRPVVESLLAWSGSTIAAHDYMKQVWASAILPKAGVSWEKALQEGVVELAKATPRSAKTSANLSAAASALPKAGSGIELTVYEKVGLGNGQQANNPWLQELPDPISKVTWDNYLAVSPKDAREKGWKQGNVVQVKAGNVTIKAPVVIQPGQTPGTVSIAAGYGRTAAGKTANGVGVNAYPLTSLSNGQISYAVAGVDVQKTADDDHALAATQTHHTMMGRAIVKETNLAEWTKDPKAGNEEELFPVFVGKEKTEQPASQVSLWNEFQDGHHHWGLAIDLNSCIGCGACVVACTSENNVSVVGKDEVMRSREMHWMRIDRYYSSDADPKEGEKGDNTAMEVPSDMPRVVFQPVMCQHCNHAPCETVCPVIATSHSTEGLNQMTYNRCVGTRYCANNCPYKVRRFNWFRYHDNPKFDYHMNDDLGKMVLNPDVTVRARGVMEKCSMCVQRIQAGKLEAKKAGVPVKDGDINTACAQSCPTNAIVFGDYNDKNSRINKFWDPKGRSYHLLEELNVQPNVFYLTKVRNSEEGKEA